MSRKPKITPKIKTFVLETRKRNHGYSVRQLAQLTESKFGIKVGKSSINNILKGAKLSRPVGRSVSTNARFSGNVFGIGYGYLLGAMRLYDVPAKIVQSLLQAGLVSGKDVELTHMFESAILAKAIYNISFKKIEDYSKNELWNLVGYKKSKIEVKEFFKQLKFSQQIAIKGVKENLSAIKDVANIRFTLADGSVFYLDARLQAIWPSASIPIEFYSNSLLCYSYVNFPIDSKAPFFVFNSSSASSPDRQLADFIYAIDGAIAQKRIRKIDFLDQAGKPVESLPLVLPQRRRFVIGLPPDQTKTFPSVDNNIATVTSDLMNTTFNLSETAVKYSQFIENKEVKIRLIRIRTNENLDKLALATNLDEKDWPAPAIVTAFLRRFGDFQQKHHYFLEVKDNPGYLENFVTFDKINSYIKSAFQNEADLDAFLENMVGLCDKLAKITFFPAICYNWSLLKTREMIYKQSGTINRDLAEDTVFKLILNKELESKAFQDASCVRFNESQIFENSGKRLWFKISPVF